MDQVEQEGLRAALAWCVRERCLHGFAEVAEPRRQHAEAMDQLDRTAALFQ